MGQLNQYSGISALGQVSSKLTILITGSREWHDLRTIEDRLRQHIPNGRPADVTLIHGGARGVDSLADAVARRLGWSVEVILPDWVTFGRAAGHMRNEAMVRRVALAEGRKLCEAFWNGTSVGTFDCIKRATAAGIEVRITPGK